jgi:hypothetical protein
MDGIRRGSGRLSIVLPCALLVAVAAGLAVARPWEDATASGRVAVSDPMSTAPAAPRPPVTQLPYAQSTKVCGGDR